MSIYPQPIAPQGHRLVIYHQPIRVEGLLELVEGVAEVRAHPVWGRIGPEQIAQGIAAVGKQRGQGEPGQQAAHFAAG